MSETDRRELSRIGGCTIWNFGAYFGLLSVESRHFYLSATHSSREATSSARSAEINAVPLQQLRFRALRARKWQWAVIVATCYCASADKNEIIRLDLALSMVLLFAVVRLGTAGWYALGRSVIGVVVQSQHAGLATPVNDRSGADSLWSSYFEGRSLEDRNRLVIFYAPLVKLVASRFASRMRSFQSVRELCSFGQFGLIDAIERFDPSAGFQFATYATTRIQGAIIDELRRDDILPKRMRARVRTYQVARETLEGELRHTPTLTEVAAYLGITLAEAVELDDHAAMSSYLVPLSIAGDDPGGSMVGSGEAAMEPSEGAELTAMRETVKAALLRLTKRQRQVLVLHYLEGFQKSEIAEALGIDRSRVTQLIHQGLRNLRLELGDQHAEEALQGF
jgi:RNA polymerase sigma factor for flagellar operon FliA